MTRCACGNVGYGEGYLGTYRGNTETDKLLPKVVRAVFLSRLPKPCPLLFSNHSGLGLAGAFEPKHTVRKKYIAFSMSWQPRNSAELVVLFLTELIDLTRINGETVNSCSNAPASPIYDGVIRRNR